MRPLLAMVAVMVAPGLASSQNVESVGKALRDDAVRITTVFQDGSTVPGFGIILREANDTLYVVTARHVVISDYGVRRQEIDVGFADRAGEWPGTFVRADDEWDLALLVVPRPPGFRWVFRSAIGVAQPGTRVGIIGRDGEWRPTADAAAGEIVETAAGEIVADFAGGRVGVSGGPLIGGGGLLGMVYADAGNTVYAYDIDVIRRHVLGRWLGLDRLDPPDFPFAALSATVGISDAAARLRGDAILPPFGFGLVCDVAVSPLLGLAFELDRAAIGSGRFDALDGRGSWETRTRFTRAGSYLTFHSNRFRGSSEYVALGVSHMWLDPRLAINGGPLLPLDQVPDAAPVTSFRAWAFGGMVGLTAVKRGEILLGFDLGISYTTTPYLSLTLQNPLAEQTGRDWLMDLRFRIGYILRPDQSRLRILR